ncbi:PD-(D/E)XK nuclease family protein [Novipirellula caenicola]|uniref:ATP-dependent helicase/deoxyribonuclease subunit B n=1 Tax=Novipirellula caenicola TaxID=1536901 RepID=A0ABP9W043_9BACT
MNPQITTEFLGWDAPLLPRAVDSLKSKYATTNQFDLSGLICVLPTSQSSYRFETLLKEAAKDAGLRLSLPKIITLGRLPEQLYLPRGTLAIDFEQTLAWSQVLAAANPETLKPLVPTLPTSDEADTWMELAATIRGLHEDLASNQLSFADVATVTEAENDQRRWTLLATLFESYLKRLAAAGLADPHHERRFALSDHACKTSSTVVLIGTSDLSHLQIAMLRATQGEIVAMVAAPANEASRFDEFGCIETSKWTDYRLPIDDEQLISAGDIADQSTAVAEVIAEFAKQYSVDEVTIGVTDESQVGPIEFEMRSCGVDTFRNLGWSIDRTAIGRLLNLTASYLKTRSWQSLATLVRHADVHAWISKQDPESADSWLTQIDQLLANHFPIQLANPLPEEAKKSYPTAIQVAKRIEKWMTPLQGANRPLGQWCGAISQWLTTLYATELDALEPADESMPLFAPEESSVPQDRTTMALHSVCGLLTRFANVNAELDLEIDGASAMQMIANRVGDLRVVDPMQPDDIEILGWLDLALDDAQALVVLGLNQPFVPTAVTNDAFLPGALRTQLRMADNDRRFARDVYNMQLLLSTRQTVRFIVGRNSADGTPTPPSRLLAAASDEDVARRIRLLLETSRPRVLVRHGWDTANVESSLPIPSLPASTGTCPVKAMSVTAFHDYLACPYRFYLRHVLKLKPLDDMSAELAANQFGDLIHGALETFGDSDDRDESDAEKIEKILLHHLHRYASLRYGDSASTAVALQIRQAERRLRKVAVEQAQRIAQGWVIKQSEASVDDKRDGACIEVDGFKMGLRGRLDRIDFHRDSGRWAILDYKTHGHKPEKKHLKKTDEGMQWIDLQLPLYRMMIPYLGIDANPTEVQLGYFNISDKDEETKINIADFDESLMDQARELILDCVRRIRDEDFAPSRDPIQYDDYDMIMQTGVMSVAGGIEDSE